ncbi:MAG: insulinase family protein [Sphingomonadales bacterium]|nr:insulinase family protein [Sphingomonadales bacterium]MBD3772844.1 insulinase family protein [Paracoccaceae bacterium]
MNFRYLLLPLALLAAPLPGLAQDAAPPPPATDVVAPAPAWGFEDSDIPLDPAWRFGTLPNGMRYIIRHNATPAGTALVRLQIGSGSLEETDSERGLAHFLEHMAFNGSKRVPEGEMVKLLEREGLAFGADTNASTGYETTTYKLDLPRNSPELLDIALMLMRETASELTIAQDAVDRERGVVLAERRDRRNFQLEDYEDRSRFLTPGARYVDRLPIGTLDVLDKASAEDIRGYYAREYVPANTVLIVVGDYDPALVEAAIKKHFASWQAAPLAAKPSPGPVDPAASGGFDIYLDPALSERVQVAQNVAWDGGADTAARRRQTLLSRIGYGIINRRLDTLARSEDPPFRGAGFGTGDIFKVGRTTNLVIDTQDGDWQRGLLAAVPVWRQALTYGFTEAEVAEQLAQIRTAQENAAAAEATRSNASLEDDAEALVNDGTVPSTARSSLARFNAFAPYITPATVLAALRSDAAALDRPLVRFRGRTAPEGGEAALAAALQQAQAVPIAPPEAKSAAQFGYTDFGPAGQVVSDRVDPRLGIREIRFANGVRLNLKRTKLQEDRVSFRLSLDGGNLLNTTQNPLATALVPVLPAGGLGKHSEDELQSILAGRSVSLSIANGDDAFTMAGTTTPRDLGLQLELMTAGLTDPGYRHAGEVRFQRSIDNFFASKDATPGSALGNAIGGILSDNDPRFTLAPKADFQALSFAGLRDAIADRLAHGAIEIGIVGDFDEDQVIAQVARTLGALPAREAEFEPREDARQRGFTAQRGQRVVRHDGEANQALLYYVWPTTDDSDLALKVKLELLERVVQLELTDELREKLGKAYSPSASNSMSPTWRGYGTFAIAASVDVGDVGPTEQAIASAIATLRGTPVDADTLERARRPLLENYDNALKTNSGWLSLVDRAQSQSERIDRFLTIKALYQQVTPDDIEAMAQQYLTPGEEVEVQVLPRANGE